jgi:Methyltransferase FkbM domain
MEHSQAVIRRRSVPSRRRRDGLIRYAADVTSQNGEDGILRRLFELLPKATPTCEHRWCVDVGAWDGAHLSNTRSLLNPSPPCPVEWRGILIEADAEKFELLQDCYQDTENACLNVMISVSERPDRKSCSLHSLLLQQENSIPNDFDFLCIDIDGSDYWVLHDLWNLSQFRPMVVCIEFNPTMPNDLVYIPPRDDSVRHVSGTIGNHFVQPTRYDELTVFLPTCRVQVLLQL